MIKVKEVVQIMDSEAIKTKEDFLIMVSNLVTELENGSSEWTNDTLIAYFKAMQGWLTDMEGYYINNNISVPTHVRWDVLSDILNASKIYE